MSPTAKHTPASPDSDEIDLGRLLGELIDHRKLIISITAVFTVLAILYALFATPVYQADALVQVEQKQGNTLLNSLSQMLPDSQPASAPEIALLQSRMVLGKTVDDLNLQAQVSEKYFPLFGRGWARLTGHPPGTLTVGRIYVAAQDGKVPALTVTAGDNGHYQLSGGPYHLQGHIGQLLEANGLSLLISDLQAPAGTTFTINYLTRLEAINNLQQIFAAADQGKETGMLNLTLTGSDPALIRQT